MISSDECLKNLELIKVICYRLGLPLKVEKVEDPAVLLVFLGILLDTLNMEMCIPDGKQSRRYLKRRAAKKRDLLLLIGKLSHAAKIVTPGRIFLRRMIDQTSQAKQLDHWIHLKSEFLNQTWLGGIAT